MEQLERFLKLEDQPGRSNIQTTGILERQDRENREEKITNKITQKISQN